MKTGGTFFSCPPSSFSPRPAYGSSSSFSPRGTIYQGKSYHGTPAYGPTLFIFTPPCVWSCLIHFHTAPCVWSILIYLCFLILTLKENWQTSQPASSLPPSLQASQQKNYWSIKRLFLLIIESLRFDQTWSNQSNISSYKKITLI